MKASEIMVKDWLRIQYKNMAGTLIEKIFQVGHIEDYNSFPHEEKGVYYIFAKGKEHGNMGKIENMMGVPLTGEILKLNDFDFLGEEYHYYTFQSGEPYINIYKSDECWECSLTNKYVELKLTLQYVHELQHALRLCGLSDMADNFKL